MVGSIYSGGRPALRLGPRTISDGFVKAEGPILLGDGATIAVGRLENVHIGAEGFSWAVAFPPGTAPALSIRSGDAMPLKAGVQYSSVFVSDGACLMLGAGHHYFDDLVFAERASLQLDSSAEPVYVWVRRRLEWRGSVSPEAAGSRLLVGYDGPSTPVIAAGIRGTLLSPHADLELADVTAPYIGAFFARDIRVAARVRLRHSAFDPD